MDQYSVVRVRCSKESSRSLSHLLMSFLLFRCGMLSCFWTHAKHLHVVLYIVSHMTTIL